MTAANHALTGAAIATVIKQPLLAVPLAFGSHFVCDIIPHFGITMKFGSRAMYYWLFFDGLAALIAASFLLWRGTAHPIQLSIAAFAAMSPDLAWFYYGKKGWHGAIEKYDPISRFHHRIQKYQKPPGIVIEIAWAGLMLYTILALQ